MAENNEDPDGRKAAEQPVADGPQIIWREVPTVIAEQVVGHAVAGGMHRFVLAEVVFNATPDATHPAIRPNINIAIPHVLLPSVIASLQRAYDGLQAQTASEKVADDGRVSPDGE